MTQSRDTGSELERLEFLDSMEGITRAEPTAPSRFLRYVPRGALLHAVYPGVLAALIIGLASTFLSDHYGAPVMLFALLIGMAFHFLHEEGRCVAGIEFASRTILRLGVALLGVRITFDQIASLGLAPILMVVAAVATTILFGVMLAQQLKLSRTFGVLSGGAVAICGVAAALAIASVLPRNPQSERDTILAVVSVTALSTIAMIVYPIFVGAIGLDHQHAGIFLGGTIHDVAQVVGAGYMISPQTGDVATYVKMLRVAMLLPVVLAIAFVLARQAGAGARRQATLLPTFLLAFAALVAVNSTGMIPKSAVAGVNDISRWCLVTAIAALGMKTSFKALIAVGWRPVGLMIAETAWIAVVVFSAVTWLV
ncbi:MAG: YeiH family protein [Alphaproteobacteria bacterium]|nr:YeiH family protein [Alphaproteobacteria bacterium]